MCGKVRHLTAPRNSFEFEPLLPTLLPTHFCHLCLFLSSSHKKDDWPRCCCCLHRAAIAPVNFFPPSSLTSAEQQQPHHCHHIGHSAAHCDALAPHNTQAPTSHLPLLPSYLLLALCVHASHPAAAVSQHWSHTHKFLFSFFFFPTHLELRRTIVATTLPPSLPPLPCTQMCRLPHSSTTTTSLL